MEKEQRGEIPPSPKKILTRKKKRDSFFFSSSSITPENGSKVTGSGVLEESLFSVSQSHLYKKVKT